MLNLKNKRIGLIFALKKEAKPFLDKNYILIREEPYKTFKGNIDDIEVFLTLSGLGKVRASSCTQHLIENYDIDFIVNAGSCGGICPKFKLGDVLLASLCIEYDFKSLREGTPSIPVNNFFLSKTNILNIPLAVLGSADSNADSEEKKNYLHSMGIQIADWEGTAVLKTCLKNKKEAVIMKVITDSSSKNFEQEFLNNINKFSYKLAEKVENFIRICYKNL
ncbi:MAG: 5'-methylthioadenosine/S-adenosylhomocysteine nucleosidase [Proteobacteria bacterium]|nr:5'-methylthioadenosine/S-adenosylhomocysteine nucleosidase [Pseudomonadota bacterium]